MMGKDKVIFYARPTYWRTRPIRLMLLLTTMIVGAVVARNVHRESGEPYLWAIPALIGAGFVLSWAKSYNTRIQVTTRIVTLRKGIFSRSVSEVRLADIRNVMVTQSMWQRMCGVGSVGVSSAGQSGVEIQIDDIKNPLAMKRAIDDNR